MAQCTNLYFDHIEVINDLVESFQMYYTNILNNPLSAPEYRAKQSDQASYYKKIIININVVLQMDQGISQFLKVYHRYLHPGMYQHEMNSKNDYIKVKVCTAHGDADIANKEMQIIHKEFITEKESRINHQQSESRLRNIDDLRDMRFSLTTFSPYTYNWRNSSTNSSWIWNNNTQFGHQHLD